MSWDSIFNNVANVIKLITMIGPIIDFLEGLFAEWFPKAKTGAQKKEAALDLARVITGGAIPEDTLSEVIDGYVEGMNKAGKYSHTEAIIDLQMTGP